MLHKLGRISAQAVLVLEHYAITYCEGFQSDFGSWLRLGTHKGIDLKKSRTFL